jgi:hypothetical protein
LESLSEDFGSVLKKGEGLRSPVRSSFVKVFDLHCDRAINELMGKFLISNLGELRCYPLGLFPGVMGSYTNGSCLDLGAVRRDLQ